MDFYVMAKSYDLYGPFPPWCRIGSFLLQDAPDFGGAIRELSVRLFFPDAGPARKTLESSLEKHNRYRITLPKITFRRASGRVEIDVASEVMDGREWTLPAPPSLPQFKRGVDEVIDSLSLLGKRLKKNDDFDFAAFLAHCEAAKNRIPADEAALLALGARISAANKARRAALSPWEKLGVDWSDFHPAARALLDDPFFWDVADDFSPHGNDTGADLLADYRRWLKQHPAASPTDFLERLAKQWGFGTFSAMTDDVAHEAAIALAFADIKIRGECDAGARDLALKSVDWQRRQAQDPAWAHRAERLAALEKIEAKLRQSIARRGG